MSATKQNETQDKNEPVNGKPVNLVINDIQIRQIVRSKQDIASWRTSLNNAESVYNPNRTRLYDLYEDVLLDGHLSGILQKRIDSVLNKELYYETPAGKKVEEMDGLIKTMVFRDTLRLIAENPVYGIGGMEAIPGPELAFEPIPRKHIKPHTRMISIEQNDQYGIPYDDYPNLFILDRNPKDLGLLLKCAPYAIYKRGNMADWANYIEIFGIPMRIIEYDANDQQTKIELKQILDESGSAMALLIPKQASFKTQDGKQTNGDGQLQERFKDSLNQEMSIIVLGNTETTSQTAHTGGTNAKAKTHSQQQNEITKSDLIQTAGYLNDKKFQAILKSYGYPVVEGGKFVFKKEIDISYLAERIDIDIQVAMLTPVPEDYWYDTYGIPKPENFEAAIKEFKEQKKAAGNPPQEDPEEDKPVNKPSKKPVKGSPAKNKLSLSKWQNLKQAAADFFVLAR